MSNLQNTADLMLINAKNRIRLFFEQEEGDTNFISILVLLGIALALAGVFLAFKDRILGWVSEVTSSFFSGASSNANDASKLTGP